VYATFTDDPVGIREAHHIGIDTLMWSSDYPHAETAWPHSKEQVEVWAGNFDQESRDKILWKNAARLYGLD
jgi:predicted TIM-barrel fold metal-dependent hydrolase